MNAAIGWADAVESYEEGDYGTAAIEAVAATIDTAAVGVPGVPGGATAGLKGLRSIASKVADKLGIGRKAEDVPVQKSPCNSFSGDTLVWAGNGAKLIESIVVGDSVWSFDKSSASNSLRKVLQVFRGEHSDQYQITFRNLDADEISNVVASADHPIFVDGKGWVRVADLENKDTLRSLDGAKIVIDRVTYADKRFDSFDLDVEGLDNFYVGDFGVLVHNQNSDNGASNDSNDSKDPKGDKEAGPKGGKKAADSGKNSPHGSKAKANSLRSQADALRAKVEQLKNEDRQKMPARLTKLIKR